MTLLEVKDVTVSYKEHIAIEHASFEAEQEEFVGFIGADGAGKSSLFYAISGVKEFKGEIRYKDFLYHSVKEAQKIKPYLGFMPQGLGLVLYPYLSVEEHLGFFADIQEVKKDKAFWEYKTKLLHMAGLLEFRQRLASHLSGGMKQKLSLICTMIHNPPLLILDEPTTGVDPLSRLELWEILDQNRKERGTLTLFSTAYMQEAQKMDKILLIDEAQIIAKGSVEELLAQAAPYTYTQTDCAWGGSASLSTTGPTLSSLYKPHIVILPWRASFLSTPCKKRRSRQR